MSRKPKKRKTAEQIAADLIARRGQDLEAVGLAPETAALPSQADIEVTRGGGAREGQRVDRDSARRLDAFEALRDGMEKGAYDAARRLERDITVSLGEHDRGRSLIRVDNDEGGDRIDAMIAASLRMEAVFGLMSDRDRWLLQWLVRPPANRFDHWRSVVSYITGETERHSQGAAVRVACGNLRDAYERLQTGKRLVAA